MPRLEDIRNPVTAELDQFESFFRSTMTTQVPLLNIITNYILRRKGKQLRPLIVFLSAGLNGKIGGSTFIAAGMIELLHTATLIHDDVVDEAYERRGFFSINALWRSKVSVLIGDFLLSKGLLLAIEKDEIELLRIMSTAVKEMSEGELLQIERSRRMNVDEAIYFEIISKKTATLIASCCANGAVSVNAPNAQVELMKEFGTALGIAFQIRDDLFDYQPNGLIGKPTGNDIKEKKLTLPLIYALAQGSAKDQTRILNLVRHSKKERRAVEEIIAFVSAMGGIDYTITRMNEYRNKALQVLKLYPESEFRVALEGLTDYVVERRR